MLTEQMSELAALVSATGGDVTRASVVGGVPAVAAVFGFSLLAATPPSAGGVPNAAMSLSVEAKLLSGGSKPLSCAPFDGSAVLGIAAGLTDGIAVGSTDGIVVALSSPKPPSTR